jgi:hypothetical protein
MIIALPRLERPPEGIVVDVPQLEQSLSRPLVSRPIGTECIFDLSLQILDMLGNSWLADKERE